MSSREAVVVERSDGHLMTRRRRLEKLGMHMVSETRFEGYLTPRQVRKVRMFCANEHARFFFDDPAWTRSEDYRQKFFSWYPPNFGKNRYICAYCGIPHTKKGTTVDHIYPIARVAASRKLQARMKKKGISSVNAKENLVPACWSCNTRKGTKMGLWVLRGRLGRSVTLWKVRYALRAAALAAVTYAAVRAGSGHPWAGYTVLYRAQDILQRMLDAAVRFLMR